MRVRIRRAHPDAEVRRLLMQMAFVPSPARLRPVEEVRRDWQLAVKAFATRYPVAKVEDYQAPSTGRGVPLRLYRPQAAPSRSPVLVWFHGGGFVFGDTYTAGATCRGLAHTSGTITISVNYRLAPEHPLEAAVDDCLTALYWVVDNAARLGIDERKVAVGGDSAGGGLAALVAQRAKLWDPLVAQLLVYPATDLTGSHPSASEPLPGMLNTDWSDWIRARISEVSDLHDPELSAIKTADLTGLPPAIVVTAGFDPLRDEGLHYAQRLHDHDVPVRLLHFPGQIHGFLTLDRVLSAGKYGIRRLGSELVTAYAEGVQPGVEDDLPRLRDRNPLLWLDPRQRLRELHVGAIVVRERVSRSRTRRNNSRTLRENRTRQ